jgi:hypothetical protein
MIMVIGPNKRYVEAQAKEAAKLARDSEQPASETEATETEATETEATETELVDSVPAAETPASNDEG